MTIGRWQSDVLHEAGAQYITGMLGQRSADEMQAVDKHKRNIPAGTGSSADAVRAIAYP